MKAIQMTDINALTDTMPWLLPLLPALLASAMLGAILGAMYFTSLWWTLRKGIVSAHPLRWFFGSLLLRMAIVLPGFYWASGGQWQRMLACLFGFVVARMIAIRVLPQADPQAAPQAAPQAGQPPPIAETPYAP
jgi:F1F0 ATPase subunit 2